MNNVLQAAAIVASVMLLACVVVYFIVSVAGVAGPF